MKTISCHLVSSNPNDGGFNLALVAAKVPVAIASGTLSGSFTAPPQHVLQVTDMNYMVTTTGTITGTFTISQSNDNDGLYFNGALQPYGVTNWAALTTVAVTGSAQIGVNMTQQSMRWLQFSWTHSSGIGSMDVNFTGKGHAL